MFNCFSRLYSKLFYLCFNNSACNMNCHHKCRKLVPNLCGVNQKELAEKFEEAKVTHSKYSSVYKKLTETCSLFNVKHESYRVRVSDKNKCFQFLTTVISY